MEWVSVKESLPKIGQEVIAPRYIKSTIVVQVSNVLWRNSWVVQAKNIHEVVIPRLNFRRVRNVSVREPVINRHRFQSPSRLPFAQDLSELS